MGLYVFPKMKDVFRGYNANLFKTFRCQTCHGLDMEAVSFKMPNRLYALPAEGAERAAMDYDAGTAKFMIEAVVPTMRELLGKNDPEVAKRINCHTCHPNE
jgi:cytochrome c553